MSPQVPAPPQGIDKEARGLIDLYAQAAEHTRDPGRRLAYLEKVALLWAELCGWYALPGPLTLTDVRIRGFFGAGVEVLVRRGQLILRVLTPVPVLYRGFVLRPADEQDPYLFRIDLAEYEMGSILVAFSRQADAGPMAVHLEAPMPLSLHMQSSTTNPRRWAQGALGALAVAGTATAVRRRRRPHEGVE